MRSRSSKSRLAALGLVLACLSQLATGQSNQDWIAIKQKCHIPSGTAYNDWVAAGSTCNSGSAALATGTGSAEQLGTALGNMTGDMMLKGIHNAFHGTPARPAAAVNSEQQQRELAARQLNNSGIYLLNRRPRDYAGAINEFEKALQQTPNDATIATNLQYAKRLQKDSVAAGQTSNMLGNLLGNNSSSVGPNNSAIPGISPNVFNQVNLDPNVVDFRGKFRNSLPGTAMSYLPPTNANALNTVLTGSDPGFVDLRGATRTSVDPKSLQTQFDGIFGKRVPMIQPPDPTVSRPQVQATGGTQSSATPRPASAEKNTKEQINDLFSKPDEPHN